LDPIKIEPDLWGGVQRVEVKEMERMGRVLGILLATLVFGIGNVSALDLNLSSMTDVESNCNYDNTTRWYYCEGDNVYLTGDIQLPLDEKTARNIEFNISNTLLIDSGVTLSTSCSVGNCTAGDIIINATSVENNGNIKAEAYCTTLNCNYQRAMMRAGLIEINSLGLNNFGLISTKTWCSGTSCNHLGNENPGASTMLSGVIVINSNDLINTNTISSKTFCTGEYCNHRSNMYAGEVSINSGTLNNSGIIEVDSHCQGGVQLHQCNSGTLKSGVISIDSDTLLLEGLINAQTWCLGDYCMGIPGYPSAKTIYAGDISIESQTTEINNVSILANSFTKLNPHPAGRVGGSINFTVNASFIPSGIFNTTGGSASGSISIWYGSSPSDYCDDSQVTMDPWATYYKIWNSMTEPYGCVGIVDSDGDGVPDPQDACPDTPAGYTVDASGCVPPTVSPNATVGGNVDLGQGVVLGDDVVVKDNVVIGNFTEVKAGAKIKEGTVIGDNVIINENAQVKQNSTIGSGTELGADVQVKKFTTVGSGVSVGANTKIKDHVTIGDDVTIGQDCQIKKRVTIGSGTSIGDGTKVKDDVVIGTNVIIGNNVVIGKGSVIGDNAVIADGTVIPPFTTI
jgi:acetyltransferase-like isoleucine patch superfamily enzyme